METSRTTLVLQVVFLLIFLSIIGFLGYENIELKKERAFLRADLAGVRVELKSTKEDFASSSAKLLVNIDSLSTLLGATTHERNFLRESLLQEREIVDLMYTQVESMSSTVGTLKKLSETDREILKKYSRVYFLNENFIPKVLVQIPAIYTQGSSTEKFVMGEVAPFLEEMLLAAATDGVDIQVISAYRSFNTQSTLKSTYRMTYGAGTANKFSADQGYSEHQLGTTIDFTTKKLGTNFTAFEKEEAYEWLTKNAHTYGFVLSYPKDNSYYIFEPWHWRFVGKDLALALHDSQKYFYDLSQRDIDQFLIGLFDE